MSRNKSKKSARGKETKPDVDTAAEERKGQIVFTNAEVLERWQRIRDASLILCEDLLTGANEVPKFLSSLVDAITRSQCEIFSFQRLLGLNEEEAASLDWLPFEPDDSSDEGPKVEA